MSSGLAELVENMVPVVLTIGGLKEEPMGVEEEKCEKECARHRRSITAQQRKRRRACLRVLPHNEPALKLLHTCIPAHYCCEGELLSSNQYTQCPKDTRTWYRFVCSQTVRQKPKYSKINRARQIQCRRTGHD